MIWTISRENFDLLSQMVELAKTRLPVQGKFKFGKLFNYGGKQCQYEEKESIPNCGISGCLASGYLPLLDQKRFYFDKYGHFFDGDKEFNNGRLKWELKDTLFQGLFYPRRQEYFKEYFESMGLGERLDRILYYPNHPISFNKPLYDLHTKSSLKKVIVNAEKILSVLIVKP